MKNILIFAVVLWTVFGGCTVHNASHDVRNGETKLSERGSSIPESEVDISDLSQLTGNDLVAKAIRPSQTEPEPLEAVKAAVSNESLAEAESLPQENSELTLNKALHLCSVSQKFWEKDEAEKALEVLDQAHTLILESDTEDQPELEQQKEDLRFMVSKRILKEYADRNIALTEENHAIPIVMNSYVQAEINAYTKGKKKNNFFVHAYKRSGKYRPLIVRELEKAGLPAELSWLPLVESEFRIHVMSDAKALGLWQFIPSTASNFGLKRGQYLDERLDPEKSTRAAIVYLRALHTNFGDWMTVLAAYNCGEGRVRRIVNNRSDKFWDFYKSLPRETARFVPKFLATLHIVSNPERYGLDSVSLSQPSAYETVEVSKQTRISEMAKTLGISDKMLKSLNPELRHNIVPGDGYLLKIPKNQRDVFISKLNSDFDSHAKSESSRTSAPHCHKIKRGETLFSIAKQYHTDVESIIKANKICRDSVIIAGKLLKIPQKGKWVSRDRKASSEYIVKKGDIPLTIAKQHKMSLNQFLRVNRLTQRSTIYPGQKLYVD